MVANPQNPRKTDARMTRHLTPQQREQVAAANLVNTSVTPVRN